MEWSKIFQDKFAGQPLKSVAILFENKVVPGEVMISRKGIEGGAIYALSSELRKSLETNKNTTIHLDLRPSLTLDQVIKKFSQPRKSQSFSSYLQRILGLNSLSINLLREADMDASEYGPKQLAGLIKSLPIILKAPFPIDRAISSAGGIALDFFDQNLMLKRHPGIFAAGEMLDWEAPTGGYLLQACFATGIAAAKGIINYASKS